MNYINSTLLEKSLIWKQIFVAQYYDISCVIATKHPSGCQVSGMLLFLWAHKHTLKENIGQLLFSSGECEWAFAWRVTECQCTVRLCQLSTVTRTAVYNMHALSSETLHFRIRREVIEVTSIYEIVIEHCPNKPEFCDTYDLWYFLLCIDIWKVQSKKSFIGLLTKTNSEICADMVLYFEHIFHRLCLICWYWLYFEENFTVFSLFGGSVSKITFLVIENFWNE